jgi:hypothetical protein
VTYCSKLERLSMSVTYTTVQYLQARLAKGSLVINTRLVRKCQTVANTLAYFGPELITTVKSRTPVVYWQWGQKARVFATEKFLD